MCNLEFKALIKGLFLTHEDVRVLGGYKDQRQIRRFVAGETKPHPDLVQKLLELDKQIDKAVAVAYEQAMKLKVDAVCLVVYDQDDASDWEPRFKNANLSLCLVFRTYKMLKNLGIKVSFVAFCKESFAEFAKKKGYPFSSEYVAEWSVANCKHS